MLILAGDECQTAARPLEEPSCGSFTDHWRKIKCSSFASILPNHRTKCSSWCDAFASCFHENTPSIQECPSKFRKFRPFKISGRTIMIEIRPCSPFTRRVFIIKASYIISGMFRLYFASGRIFYLIITLAITRTFREIEMGSSYRASTVLIFVQFLLDLLIIYLIPGERMHQNELFLIYGLFDKLTTAFYCLFSH